MVDEIVLSGKGTLFIVGRQIYFGQGVTGLNAPVFWGLYLVNFIYWVGIALFVLLIIDPFAPLAADFWLSFCAIFVIAYGMTCRPGWSSLWWRRY